VGLDEPARIPAISLSREEGEWLRHRMQSDGDAWKLRIRVEAHRTRARARNVIGEIPGADREEILLLGAHLDAWSLGAGALDNGTGVGVLLETARLLAQLQGKGWRPARSIRFVLFMAEEPGLIGSRAYVAEHRRDLDRIRAMINLEMVGEPRAYVSHGHDEAVETLEATARRLRGLGLGRTRNSILLHSDHQPFLLEGVPTIGLLSAIPPAQSEVYHSAADTFDKLDFPALQRSAAATAVLLYDLASAGSLALRRYGRGETAAMLESQGVLQVLSREGVSLPGSR
jgi:carboxypeptidase Q